MQNEITFGSGATNAGQYFASYRFVGRGRFPCDPFTHLSFLLYPKINAVLISVNKKKRACGAAPAETDCPVPVQEVIRALGGTYTPTNMYALETRPARGLGQGIYFPFLLPPGSVEYDEPTRSVYTPTLGGGFVTDHGNEAKRITVEGQFHFYYAGSLGGQTELSRPVGGEADLLDGYSEFRRIRYVSLRYRDHTLNPRGRNALEPLFGSPALAPALAFQGLVNRSLASGDGALYDKIALVWHDHDKDSHFVVRVERFRSRESSADPFTAFYTLVMEGVQIDALAIRVGQITRPLSVRTPAREQMARVEQLHRNVHLWSAPETVNVPVPGGTVPLTGNAA
jgi:hypothetical protein